MPAPNASSERAGAELRVLRPRAERLPQALGIGTPAPRLSWRVETPIRNWLQAAYELERLGDAGREGRGTGRIESGDSVLVDWPFEPLASRARALVRARVWGRDGGVSGWSEALAIEAGLLEREDWEARFVGPDWRDDPAASQVAPYLRREFELRPGIRSARLYLSALGLYEAELNGERVGDRAFAPGWTAYDKRLLYQTYDATGLLRPGRNALGAILGEGWYKGRLGFGGGKRAIWGENLALLAQLEVTYEDGSIQRVCTDDSWKAARGPILSSGIYDGEAYDARLELAGWSEPGYDDSAWVGVKETERDLGTLCAPIGPPVRRTQALEPVSITRSPSGRTILDFGQNLVGRLSIRLRGEAGRTVTLRHAEVLEAGELCTRPLRLAEATDRYTLRGGGEESWEPRFTFHGFRYAEVSGWPGDIGPGDVAASVLHSDMERTGWFECSDPELERLHENVRWSMRGNFLEVPTDCPQRDERLGWTGDIQVFSPTASFLYDSSGLLASWLADLAIEQAKNGGVPTPVAPNALGEGFGAAAWADAAAVLPWVLYERFGDREILAAQFESMAAWVDHVESEAGERRIWDSGFQFGDWLDPAAPPDRPWQARTDKAIVASAYFARSAGLTARAAAVLGREADRARYAALAAEAKAAFAAEYVTPAGRLVCDAQTAYALAIAFDLLPTPAQRRRAGERLAELCRDSGYHIRTGFVGTPLILDALSSTGHYREAYRLLTQRECPSWLYPVTMGATTIWERWDSMLPDGSINTGEMTSFNHYALGAVADWMHRFVGGLEPAAPGYRRIRFAPRPGGGLSRCRVRHLTPYGPAECSWRIEAGRLGLEVTVPPNATAEVILPGSESGPLEVGSGTWDWSVPYLDPDLRGPYTTADLSGEIMSDPAARDAVLAALGRLGAPGFVTAILFNDPNNPLAAALRLLPDACAAARAIDEALARL